MIAVFSIGEFASRAGVSVRTVRYYDQVGLLTPSAYSEGGRRLYAESDFARLQQILTLKLIGLSLDEIKQVLTSDLIDIHTLLERQKQMLQAKVAQFLAIIHTIETAQASQFVDLAQFINIIWAVNMSNQTNWLAQFLNEEQQRQLIESGQNLAFAEQKRAGEAWKVLFQDIFASLDKNLDDPSVQTLVSRWDDLMSQYGELQQQLTAAYAQLDSFLAETPEWMQEMSRAAVFIQKARGI